MVYEIDYLWRKFRLIQALIFLFFLGVLVVISWGDTHSFFTGENSPIPESWTIFQNKNVVNLVSVSIIIASYLLPWLSDFLVSQKESRELIIMVEENLIPAIDLELKYLKTKFRRSFKLSKGIRISIFIPIRRGFLRWHFQMICRTSNIPPRELSAKFKLDEGVIGCAFLKNQKQCMVFIDVSPHVRLPSEYKKLTPDNEILIDSNIRAVSVAGAFQKNSIAGLIAIDTDNDADIPKIQEKEVHDQALNWILERSKVVKLLWRIKNNV